jgi:LuxR family quorum sensing-dependent transcriptional regulator
VATLSRASFDSFAWDEAPITGTRARRVMDISAQDYGLKRGFCVPIHGTGGYQATVTMAGHDVDTSRQARKAIEMMAYYAFKTDLKLKSQTRKPLLSPREREVMRWAAAGKSAWDTGEILRISEQTVKKHMSAVLAKLDVCSKMQAIAESIRRGEIAP